MKKSFILTVMALLLAVGASAQDKKTWDFTKGLSEETVANLNADAANWTSNGTDANGVTNNWQNAVKPSTTEPLTANGEVIKETAGLLFDIGNNKSNSIHIAQDKIRLTRANTTITFPQLKNGQTITIVGRSANGNAGGSEPARGIAPVQDYLKYVGDAAALTNGACQFQGNNVENSLGTYTFKWQVETTSADAVDVQFKLTPNAGIDFTLFMIDSGDELVIIKTAYLYDGADDAVLSYLTAREDVDVTPINVTTTAVTAEELRNYDVTVVSPSVSADYAGILKEALPWTPVLNLNGNMYTAWGYGEAVSLPTDFIKLTTTRNTLFTNVEYISEDGINALPFGGEAYALKLDEYFAGDDILGTTFDEEYTLIHTHNVRHNGYIYLPGSDNYTDPVLQTISNAISILKDSKNDITAAATPSISQEYKDQKTIITLTPGLAQPKTQMYYTTNGSEPTVESGTLYTEPFTVSTVCTVKAIAIAEGYTASAVASADVAIYSQPKTPTISWVEEEGKTIITLACETADAQIWYNFEETASKDTVKSSKYSEPFTITMPQYVNVFSVAGETVWSEVATQRVLVKNPRVVIDVAAHFSAPSWEGISNGSGLFSGGKSATSMYVEGTGTPETTIDPETGDEVTVWTGQEEVEYETKDESGDNPKWTVMTKGQAVLWQNNGANTDKVGTDDGGYYPETSEDISSVFAVTKNDIQFASLYAGEPANAAIQSKEKYQAPLDIVVLANMQGGPLVAQISADGESWTTIGEEIEKTGWSRMWKMYIRSYDGTDEVYVRIAQEKGSAAAKIFDIYVANQGEKSQELLDQLNAEYATGIKDVKQTMSVAAGIYNLNGVRQNSLKRGLNIVVTADGTVKKVIVK